MPAPDCGRSRAGAAQDRSSPLLLGLLRKPFIDAGEVSIFVVAVEASESRRAAPLHLVRHGGMAVALDESRQLYERPFAEFDRVAFGGRAVLTAIIAARGVDITKLTHRPLTDIAEPTVRTVLGDRRFERKLRSVEIVDMTRQRRPAGLVVVDDNRAVLADVNPVGASGQFEARGKRERAFDLRVRARGECPPRRLGRGEPEGELLEGRPPKGFHSWRAAKLIESTIGEGDQLSVDVCR